MSIKGIDNFLKSRIKDWSKRDEYVNKTAWAIPSKEAIQSISQFAGKETILEIGAGLGYWAMLIIKKGGKIIATDSKKSNWKHNANPPYVPIIKMNHKKALKTFTNASVLFLCWPPYDTPMAYESLEGFQGNKLIYIGEGDGGCNGTDEFFQLLNEHWKEIKTVNIKQWYGIHDRLFLYERVPVVPLTRSLIFERRK